MSDPKIDTGLVLARIADALEDICTHLVSISEALHTNEGVSIGEQMRDVVDFVNTQGPMR